MIEDQTGIDNPDDPRYPPRAKAPVAGTQPYQPPAPPQGSTPQAPIQPSYNAPDADPNRGEVPPMLSTPQTKGSGDTGYDWLGFAQGYTGGQNVSRGGSNGGFITGGQQYRGNLQPVVDAYNAKYGAKAAVAGPDKIDFGDGRGPQDVITSGGDFWYGGPPGSMQQGAPQGGGPGAAGGAGAPGSAPGVSTSPFQDQLRQILLGQLQGLAQPVSASDPAIANEMTAQGNVLEQNRQGRRAADAERAAMQGLLNGGQSSGSFDTNVASGYEDKGRALTGIQAQLFTREIQSRRQSLAQMMSMALQTGDAEMARAIQLQLAQLDATLRREGYGVSLAEFGQNQNTAALGL